MATPWSPACGTSLAAPGGVTGHGVRRGAAVALATAQFQSGYDFLQVEPVHLMQGGEDWWAFKELADDMEMAATGRQS